MLALKCLSPQYVYNPIVKGKISVGCGHCLPCRCGKRNVWISRLNKEREHSALSLFITLTYDNDHVPLASVDKYGKRLMFEHTALDWIHPEEKMDDLSHLGKSQFVELCSFIPCVQQGRVYRKKLEGKFAICMKSDVQKFVKRLRSRLRYDKDNVLADVSPSERTFRYFIVSEYGPNTFRPHYHGILFFGDERVARAVEYTYLRKSWRLCDPSRVDVQEVVSNASSYVAKYINCDTAVPPVLSLESTRTFYLFSKNPCIGFVDDVDDLFAFEFDRKEKYDSLVVSSHDAPRYEVFAQPSYVTRYYFPRFLCCSNTFCFSRFYQTLLECGRRYALTGYLPDLVDDVSRKYHLGSYGRSVPSEHLTEYSDCEFCYGFPINRTFIRRVGDLINRFGLTISAYDILYKKHLARSFTNRFERYAQWQSERMVDKSSAIYLAFHCINGMDTIPRYAEELPEWLLYDMVVPLLRSYGLSVMDLYDVKGVLRSVPSVDPEMTSFYSALKVKEDFFFIKRKHNYLRYGD